ncbi:MAG: hypothetical protein IJC16_01650 [Rikenellaceae bacterium]|nr:hypothetical protein [Rikenellaceae bacterium]
MKRFLWRTGLAVSILALVLTLSLLASRSNPGMRDSLFAAMADKDRMLDTTPSPRIILVGGSNLAYGIDSRRISRAFGLPVVNTGLNAGMGLYYIMERVRPYIRTGDIVVLSPEYSHFFGEQAEGDIALTTALVMYPGDWRYLGPRQVVRQLPYLAEYGARSLSPDLKDLPAKLGLVRRAESGAVPGINTRRAYDGYGDHTAHLGLAPREIEFPVCLLQYDRPNPRVMAAVEELAHDLEVRGARLVVVPQVFQRQAYERLRHQVDEVADGLARRGCGALFEPERYALADSLFFDTVSHTDSAGRRVRTTRLIEDLARVLPAGRVD